MIMKVVSGDNWSCKTYKAQVKLSPPTNQNRRIFYKPDALPVAQPTVQSTERIGRCNCWLAA